MSCRNGGAARCTACRKRREVDDLLLILKGEQPAYAVCRPSVDPRCFGTVGPASSERIVPLLRYLNEEPADALR